MGNSFHFITYATMPNTYDNDKLWKTTLTIAEKYKDGKDPIYDTSGDFYDLLEKDPEKKREMITLEMKARTDAINVMNMRDDMFIDYRKEAMANYQLETSKRAQYLKEKDLSFRTNECQPIVRTFTDRLHGAIIRANFTTNVYPDSATKESAKRVQNLLASCWYRAKVKESLNDTLFDTTLFGLWFARTGFRITPEVAKQIKELNAAPIEKDDDGNDIPKNNPDLKGDFVKFEWVSLFNIYGEPGIPFNKQRRLIYRKIMPLDDIEERIAWLVTLTKDMKAFILDKPQQFSTKNYDLIRLIKYYRKASFKRMPDGTKWISPEDQHNIDEFFELKTDDGHCEYCEFWLKKNLLIYVNGFNVYDWPNPRWDGTHPFKVSNFTRCPGTWIADGAGTLLAWSQKLYNSLYNMTFDLTKLNAGPMFVLKPGQSIRGNKDGKMVFDPFSFIQMEGGDTEINALKFPDVNPASLRVTSDIMEMANFMIAPSAYNQAQWVSRSATDAQFKYEWLKDSIVNMMESVNEMLADTYRDWISTMRTKMPKEFNFFYPKWDKGKGLVKWRVTKEDLEGEYSYEISSESIKEMNKIVERQQFLELLKVLQTVGNDPVTGRWLIDMPKLAAVAIDLFNQDLELLLEDDDYVKQLKWAEQIKIKLQKEIRKMHEDAGDSFSPEEKQAYAQQKQAEAEAEGGPLQQWPPQWQQPAGGPVAAMNPGDILKRSIE